MLQAHRPAPSGLSDQASRPPPLPLPGLPPSPPDPAAPAPPSRSPGRGIAPAPTSAVLTGIEMAGPGLAAPRGPAGPAAASSREHPGHDEEDAERQHGREQHLLHGRQRHGRRLLPAAGPGPATAPPAARHGPPRPHSSARTASPAANSIVSLERVR